MKIDNTLINKVLSGKASNEERELFGEWAATDAGQRALGKQIMCDGMSMSSEEIAAFSAYDIPTQRMRSRFLSAIAASKPSFKWLRVAAVVLPFVVLSTMMYFVANRSGMLDTTEYAQISVPDAERITVVLADGTVVELNSATTLRYPKRFGLFSRDVELTGEGYFKVAKDSKRPFHVYSNGLDVEVTGTEFNVRAYDTDSLVTISLDEGSVVLNDTQRLKPSETATYNVHTGVIRLTQTESRETQEAWRTRGINFELAPLRDIVIELKRQYGVKFIVNDSSLLDRKYTLSSSKADIGDVLKDIETVSRIRFVKRGTGVYEVTQAQ